MSSDEVKDRKLGDEWEDWNGTNLPAAYHETPRLFILFGFVAVLLIDLLGLGILYMIHPRVLEWHPWTVVAVEGFGGGLLILFTIWFLGLVLGIAGGKNLAARGWFYRFFLESFGPAVFTIGTKLGVNRDRLFNSFLYVNNTMVRETVNVGAASNVLVLLPRCLGAGPREALQEMGGRTGAKVFVAGGGDQARELVRKHRPRAIVAVACERDLVSGLRDVGAKVPVIALANERPEGPCKNTCVDPRLVEEAVRRLSGTF